MIGNAKISSMLSLFLGFFRSKCMTNWQASKLHRLGSIAGAFFVTIFTTRAAKLLALNGKSNVNISYSTTPSDQMSAFIP
jgi:hypothetical protein